MNFALNFFQEYGSEDTNVFSAGHAFTNSTLPDYTRGAKLSGL